jgi:hypothetical protein
MMPAQGDLMSCLYGNPALDEGCASCACETVGCYLAIAECDDSCLALIACMSRYCAGLEGSERTQCAIDNCIDYVAAATQATQAFACLQPCQMLCSDSLEAVLGPDGQLDAGLE